MMSQYRPSKIILELILFTILLLGLSLDVSPVSAAAIEVDTTVDEDTSNGSCSLREAIKAANTNAAYNGCSAGSGADVITLPAGIYTLSSQLPNITSEIVINGDDDTTTIIEASTCNPVTLPGGCTPAAYRIFNLNTGSSNLTLNDLTLRHGGDNYGGAICSYNGTLTINDSTLSDNHANDPTLMEKGGAIYIDDDVSVNISGSTIARNVSDEDAGGIYNNEGSLTIINSILDDNDSVRYGGGIYNSGTLVLTGTTISDSESQYGGGIHTGGSLSSATISECTFSGNHATTRGGAIENKKSVTLTDSTLSGNSAESHGGGINNYNSSTINITGCTLSGNEAEVDGGGIYNGNFANLYVTNSTLSGNTAVEEGGGIFTYSTSLTYLTNCTLTDNSAAPSGGGGIYNDGTLEYKNTIIANSTGGGDCYTTPPTGISQNSTNNLVEDGGCDADYSGDPNLGALADNGGPTHTHALLTGSSAIDMADGVSCPGKDQRGYFRPVDGDGSGGAQCDIGAYEYGSYDAVFTYLPLILKQ